MFSIFFLLFWIHNLKKACFDIFLIGVPLYIIIVCVCVCVYIVPVSLFSAARFFHFAHNTSMDRYLNRFILCVFFCLINIYIFSIDLLIAFCLFVLFLILTDKFQFHIDFFSLNLTVNNDDRQLMHWWWLNFVWFFYSSNFTCRRLFFFLWFLIIFLLLPLKFFQRFSLTVYTYNYFHLHFLWIPFTTKQFENICNKDHDNERMWIWTKRTGTCNAIQCVLHSAKCF